MELSKQSVLLFVLLIVVVCLMTSFNVYKRTTKRVETGGGKMTKIEGGKMTSKLLLRNVAAALGMGVSAVGEGTTGMPMDEVIDLIFIAVDAAGLTKAIYDVTVGSTLEVKDSISKLFSIKFKEQDGVDAYTHVENEAENIFANLNPEIQTAVCTAMAKIQEVITPVFVDSISLLIPYDPGAIRIALTNIMQLGGDSTAIKKSHDLIKWMLTSDGDSKQSMFSIIRLPKSAREYIEDEDKLERAFTQVFTNLKEGIEKESHKSWWERAKGFASRSVPHSLGEGAKMALIPGYAEYKMATNQLTSVISLTPAIMNRANKIIDSMSEKSVTAAKVINHTVVMMVISIYILTLCTT